MNEFNWFFFIFKKIKKVAGITGTIDFLSGLGNLFLKRGYSTPLLHLGLAYKQLNILEAKESVSFIAKKLQK